jgi:ABC-type branched-subunit amino acid transport system substrate-binding protein
MVDSHVAAVGPAQLLQALHECRNAGLPFHIVRGYIREHADAPHGLFLSGVADAQSPSGVVRIGILNDQSGPYADFGGKTSVDAARMAVEDVGGKVLGKSIEIIIGDHQNFLVKVG